MEVPGGVMTETAVILDWHGPFKSFRSARREILNRGWTDGLYFVHGRHRPFPVFDPHFQYIGESGSLVCRLDQDTHHKLPRISPIGVRIWIGILSNRQAPPPPGGPPLEIKLAEEALIYYLPCRLNEKGANTLPDKPIVIRNRWVSEKHKTAPRLLRKYWPDLIEHFVHPGETHLVWLKPNPRIVRRCVTQIRGSANGKATFRNKLAKRLYPPKIAYPKKWNGTQTPCDKTWPPGQPQKPFPCGYI